MSINTLATHHLAPLPGRVAAGQAAPQPLGAATGTDLPVDRVTNSSAEHDESKTIPQHVGLASLGVASLGVVSASVSKFARIPHLAKEVPGLNLGLAGLEAFNAVHQTVRHKPVEAAGHAGNSLGCLAAAAEDVGRVAALVGGGGTAAHALAHWGRPLGLLGGVVGIVQSSAELREGLQLKEAHPKAYTKKMILGSLGVASGAATVGGIVMSGARALPGVGLALLAVASACDLASVGFEYKSTKETEEASRH